MKEYFKVVQKNVTINSCIFLLIFSFMVAGIFKDYVNGFVTLELLPKVRIVAVLPFNESIEINTDDLSFSTQERIFGSVRRQVEWQELPSGEYEASFEMIASPTEYIYIPINSEMKEIRYTVDYTEEILRQFTESEINDGGVKIYPFESSYLKIIYQITIYCIMTIILFFLFLLCHIFLSENHRFNQLFSMEYGKKRLWFIVVWAFLYLIVVIEYKLNIGLPHYIPDNALGDQGVYWATYIFKDGTLNWEYCSQLASFRGYTTYLIPSLCRWLGYRLALDPVLVYLLFPPFVYSWLLTIIFPKFYVYFHNESPCISSVVISIAVVTFYWNGSLTLVMTDFYCVVLFFAVIVYMMETFKEKKVVSAAIAGLSLGILINMRLSYYYYLLAMAICVMIIGLFKVFINRKIKGMLTGLTERFKEVVFRNTKGLVILLFFSVLVSVPQGIINYKAGHVGLLPYDSESAYGGYPVTWSGWNTFLTRGLILWPKFIGDDQLISMKTQLYSSQYQILNVPQAMDVYANSPIETMVCCVKKMFTGFDEKSNIQYPDVIDWRGTKGLAFSFFNYLILSIGFYVLFYYRGIHRKEKLILVLSFACTILPCMQGHCEWRWFLPGYMILYYLFSYHFLGEVVSDSDQYRVVCNESFLRFIVLSEIFAFTLSLTLWA